MQAGVSWGRFVLMNPNHLTRLRRSLRIVGALLVSLALVAWMTLSDDWAAILNDGSAGSALSVAVGVLLAGFLLGMLGFLMSATNRHD